MKFSAQCRIRNKTIKTMHISKKAIMSFIVALTSVVSMAQPYYHIMKEDNGKLTEQKGYNGMDYKIKIDMVKSEIRPKEAIGGKITVESDYDCTRSSLKRSFWFTKNGNVYYNDSTNKFYFEKSQLDFPSDPYTKNHCGHFRWGTRIKACIGTGYPIGVNALYQIKKETDFYFANPENLPKLQEDLGNEKWAVLSACEWEYVCETLGEYGWKVDGKTCFLIDTTPDKSLLRSIEAKNGGKTMSKADFESYEDKGLVCLPASGYRSDNYYDINHNRIIATVAYDYSGLRSPEFSMGTVEPYFVGLGSLGYYWSCTPFYQTSLYKSFSLNFDLYKAGIYRNDSDGFGDYRYYGYAVRLVVLADD